MTMGDKAGLNTQTKAGGRDYASTILIRVPPWLRWIAAGF